MSADGRTAVVKTFTQIGAEIGELVAQKFTAYGDSIAAVNACMLVLYPKGISPAQMEDALLQVRMLDKHCRLATANDPAGESPYVDLAGYAIRGIHKTLNTKESAQPCVSANGPAANNSHQAPRASAAPATNETTTTSANATSEPPSTPESPAKSRSDLPASANEGRWVKLNAEGKCIICERRIFDIDPYCWVTRPGKIFYRHSTCFFEGGPISDAIFGRGELRL